MEALAHEERRTSEVPVTDLKPGEVVWIESLREQGEVLTPMDDKGKVRVQVGNVKLTIEVTQLRRLEPPEAPPVPGGRRVTAETLDQPTPVIKPELDVRGMDSLAALAATDDYLTRAVQAGWEEVRIIHGKGSGVLRQKINQFLARDQRVLEKRLGRWGEGDTGVTIVRLKK